MGDRGGESAGEVGGERSRILPRRDAGPLEVVMDEFIAWGAAEGYAVCTQRNHVRAAARMGEWMSVAGLGLGDLDDGTAARFVAADNRAHPSHRSANENVAAVGRFLSDTGRLSPQAPAFARPGAGEECLRSWCRSLVRDGYGPSWIDKARQYVGPFVALIEDEGGGLDWGRVEAGLLHHYVFGAIDGYSSSTAQCIVALLRAFCRWAWVEGMVDRDHSDVVLSVHRIPAATVTPLDSSQIAALIESIDVGSRNGRRDLAIVTMIARLGLRAGEVAGLTLDDIDWASGKLEVVGKGGRHLALPLPVDVGQAVVDYLRVRRAANDVRQVFVRSLPPLVGMTRSTISLIVTQRAEVAGLGGVYAHRLRHTVASRVIAGGGDLFEVRELLGHARLSSSLGYARAVTRPLRDLSVPWGCLP